MVWGSGNSNGKPTADGDLLKARVTFTGLPTTSAFGAKEVAVSYKQQQVEVSTFEVFYLKKETNHPGAGSGETPNWFYYWNQTMAGDEDHVIYLANVRGNRGAVNAMLLWDMVVVFDKSEIAVSDGASETMQRQGHTGNDWKATGIDCFANIVRHEQGHVAQIAGADALLGGLNGLGGSLWERGWSWNTDTDLYLPRREWLWNHITLGTDNEPGIAGIDDDNDGVTDEYGDNTELDFYGVYDVNIDSNRNDVPDVWEPYSGEGACEARETVTDGMFKNLDWGAPGKNHLSDDYAD